MTEKLVFANTEDERVEIDGIHLFEYVNVLWAHLMSCFKSPVNVLLFNLPFLYCLLPELWYAKYMEWRAEKAIKKVYENRRSDKRRRNTNLLDIII